MVAKCESLFGCQLLFADSVLVCVVMHLHYLRGTVLQFSIKGYILRCSFLMVSLLGLFCPQPFRETSSISCRQKFIGDYSMRIPPKVCRHSCWHCKRIIFLSLMTSLTQALWAHCKPCVLLHFKNCLSWCNGSLSLSRFSSLQWLFHFLLCFGVFLSPCLLLSLTLPVPLPFVFLCSSSFCVSNFFLSFVWRWFVWLALDFCLDRWSRHQGTLVLLTRPLSLDAVFCHILSIVCVFSGRVSGAAACFSWLDCLQVKCLRQPFSVIFSFDHRHVDW